MPVTHGAWHRGSEPEPDSVECEGDMMKSVTREEFDEAMRNKQQLDEMADMLKCKPSEVVIRTIELLCKLKEMKIALRALVPPSVEEI